MSPEETRAQAAGSLSVEIRWGSSVLHVEPGAPPRPFSVGTEPGRDGEAHAQIHVPALGARLPILVARDDGSIALAVPAGAEGWIAIAAEERRAIAAGETRFPLGSKAQFDIQGLAFTVAHARAERSPARRWHLERKHLPFVVGSGILQIGALWALSFFRSPVLPPGEVSPERVIAIQTALADIEEKQAQQKATDEVAAAAADSKEGGSGMRARGEEGSMGNPNSGGPRHRFGVQGPADPHVSRQAALREAAEFGMVGLLNSGAGGDPNAPSAPWGRDAAAGSAPIAARGNLGPSGSPAAAAPQAQAIDPNGRFATTYRPGGGHLAAFESAVARGVVPEAAREVVSDVGARYAPAVDVPAGKALGLRVDLERSRLAPGGGAFHVRLALRGTSAAPAARPHLSVHLVLDVSGSMQGESISRAREAAAALVDRLAPTDDFSLTTFSSGADVRVPDGLVGARREAIKRVIAGIGVDGGTNIGGGLSLGYQQASAPGIPEDAVKVVLLLSDGRANEGITSVDRLSRLSLDAFQKGVQTSALGLGADYDGALMSSIAGDGAGGYYYLRNADQIAPALATELEKRLDPVATAVEVRVRLKNDVSLLRVYGSRRLNEAESARVRAAEVASDQQAARRDKIAANRQDDAEGGMRFFIPAFARDDSHAMLLQLRVPAGAGGRPVALVELKYKDRVSKRNVIEEIPVEAAYGDSDAQSGGSVDASVARTIQGFAAGEALTDAATRIATGDRVGALALLAEREAILRQASTTLGEPLFLRDADRLARLRGDAERGSGMGEALTLSMLLETAGKAHLR
jgi:hypothetical protein